MIVGLTTEFQLFYIISAFLVKMGNKEKILLVSVVLLWIRKINFSELVYRVDNLRN